jgi:hypothetical protein
MFFISRGEFNSCIKYDYLYQVIYIYCINAVTNATVGRYIYIFLNLSVTVFVGTPLFYVPCLIFPAIYDSIFYSYISTKLLP